MRRIVILFMVVTLMVVMQLSPAFAVGSVGGSSAGNDYAVGTNGSKIGGGSEAAGHKGGHGRGNPGADAGTHGSQAGGGVEF